MHCQALFSSRTSCEVNYTYSWYKFHIEVCLMGAAAVESEVQLLLSLGICLMH